MKLQRKLFVVFSLLLGGCLRPNKPVVELCVVDYPRVESICGMTGQGANTTTYRYSLDYLDKATALRPSEWKKIKDYIDKVEAYVNDLEERCK